MPIDNYFLLEKKIAIPHQWNMNIKYIKLSIDYFCKILKKDRVEWFKSHNSIECVSGSVWYSAVVLYHYRKRRIKINKIFIEITELQNIVILLKIKKKYNFEITFHTYWFNLEF